MTHAIRRFDAISGVTNGLRAWAEPVTIPTYPVMPPDRNPMFLEKRVYQGSSGRVYPLPFVDRVGKHAEDRDWAALHLENEHLYVMVLPEIGGRIHIGFDKIAGYDFFYRQNVIKPALVGLAGPWISGGVEFNWPQHHRPSTYMPCEWRLEEHADGSRTFWLSEHEPMNRMKGMHGVCLRPGSSAIELKVRLYNRTPFVQTFLWWANVAARVHERYQSFFPPDVTHVADHAKRSTSSFPACTESYYGVPYGEREQTGVPEGERAPWFVPDASIAPNRLDWYGNIPVPTSYMVVSTGFEFFGGYDHAKQAGFVHVADRHISPGKKQWTWGNHEFGYAWDRNLTEEGGPYVELMAGVYTDNQPDFSFLAPYETKSFSQFWYPIREIGPASNATRWAALSVQGRRVGVCPSQAFSGARIHIGLATGEIERRVDLDPLRPFVEEFDSEVVVVRVFDAQGRSLVAFDKTALHEQPEPKAATEPPAPSDIRSNAELLRTGLHLDQYRHATRAPEPYWEEAISRDPTDSGARVALARRLTGRGLYGEAESHLRQAISALTQRNPNPYDGEAYYQLGTCLELQGRDHEALDAYGKAAWNYAWKAPAQIGMARLSMRAEEFDEADALLSQALVGIGDCNTARVMRAAIARIQNRPDHALALAEGVLAYDPLDHWALFEASLADEGYRARFESAMRSEVQNYIDLALDLRACGLEEDCRAVLEQAPGKHAVVLALLGQRPCESDAYEGLFPVRLGELDALLAFPDDPVANALAGHQLYDRRRYGEAIERWEASVRAEPNQSIVWRNLGIAYFNVENNPSKARDAYERALQANPEDGRLYYERDQLWKRTGVAPIERLRALEAAPKDRDDLILELSGLYNQLGQPEQAAALLASRHFAPWEGGEGVASGQHARAHALLARKAPTPQEAVTLLRRALSTPENLGEARHLLANASDLWVALGDALAKAGFPEEAEHEYVKAAEFRGDFQEMSVRTFSEMTYYRVLALRRLGRETEAMGLAEELERYSIELEQTPAKIDYFATSLPTMLLFDDDLQARQTTSARFLRAQARLAQGDLAGARALLDDVLRRDPNHSLAQDLMADTQTAASLRL